MLKNRSIEVFMWVTAIFVASNIYLFIPIYSDVAKALCIPFKDVVFSSSLFTFSYSLGLLSFGPISEKYSKKKVLFFGIIVSCIFTYLISFSFSLWSFYVLRIAQGFILGSFAPVAYAYCFDVLEEKRRTLVIAVINMGFLMAGIIGQLISSYLVATYEWRAVFYFFSCVYLLLGLLGLFILPSSIRVKTTLQKKKSWKYQELCKPSIILGLGVTFFTLMSFVAFYDSLSRHFAGDAKELFYMKGIGLIGTPLSLLSGKWLKKYKVKKMLYICLTTMVLSLVLMVFPSSMTVITVFSTIFVAAIAVFIPTLITFIGESASTSRSTAISLYSFLLLVGASLGPVVASFLSFHAILLLFAFIFGMTAYFFAKEGRGETKAAR
ncbi:MAG: MFS transporter [Heyndrickxia sp.]